MGSTVAVDGQTVVVPATPYSADYVQMSVAATALLDADSVFMCYQEGLGFGSNRFQVVNINTGAVELSPQLLPVEGVSPTCAVVASDTAVIAIRNDVSKLGTLFVVNPLTGFIKHGPVIFGRSGNGFEYRVAAVNASSVFIAWRSDDRSEGRFAIVDPTTGSVRVPETTFDAVGINTVDVVALDTHRVALAYQRAITGPIVPTRSLLAVRDAHSGAILRDPVEFESSFGITRMLRVTGSEVLITYRTATQSRFAVADPLAGTTSPPVTYTTGLTWDFSVSPTLVGSDAVFIPYWRPESFPSPGFFVLTDLGGAPLVSETPFTPPSSHVISAVASGCRVFVTYPDGTSGTGMFQVLEFSDLCRPLPCPTDVTGQVDIFGFPPIAFLFPGLRLQLVLVHNRASDPIAGPLFFALAELQRAVLYTGSATACTPPGLVPYVPFGSAEDVLAPNETAAVFLLFGTTSPGPITYTPRLLKGTPPR